MPSTPSSPPAGSDGPSREPWPDAAQFLESAPCGLLQTDADGLILWANRTFCQWAGYDCAALCGKRRLQDLLTMGGRIFHQTHWAPLMRMQGSISEVKLEIETADGTRLPLLMSARLHATGGKQVQEVAVYVARDRDAYERELVQSRKRLEEAVAEAKRLRDEAADRALFAEQMVGIVSHDLRNPLSAIHMAAVLLARMDPADKQRPVIARIGRSTDRANRMISDLLDFTQARIGKGISVTPRELRLAELVHDCVDELRLAFADCTLVHDHEGSDEVLEADPDRLTQLVGNLVANAIAYGAADRPVTVRSSVRPERFEIAVHNWGKPIPHDLQHVIFEPLARGAQSSSPSRSLGLGLFIVSEIARAHGGAVRVRSDDAHGTQFVATFPRAAS
jgi:sigma-B regulation protein RsbU (phosphoserine phosphatase)